jgi:hypothetical protein
MSNTSEEEKVAPAAATEEQEEGTKIMDPTVEEEEEEEQGKKKKKMRVEELRVEEPPANAAAALPPPVAAEAAETPAPPSEEARAARRAAHPMRMEIVRQVEFYLSSLSLPFDDFLLGKLDQGGIPASVLANASRMKQYTPDLSPEDRASLIAEVIAAHSDSLRVVRDDVIERRHPLAS